MIDRLGATRPAPAAAPPTVPDEETRMTDEPDRRQGTVPHDERPEYDTTRVVPDPDPAMYRRRTPGLGSAPGRITQACRTAGGFRNLRDPRALHRNTKFADAEHLDVVPAALPRPAGRRPGASRPGDTP